MTDIPGRILLGLDSDTFYIYHVAAVMVDTEQEPTQVVNHDRRNMVDVKSIAI